jgi:hypothetical protein
MKWSTNSQERLAVAIVEERNCTGCPKPNTSHHHITQHRALDKYTSDHHLNIPHNTNRQSPESSEHQILCFHVIPSLMVIDNLTTTFNQYFNNRRGQ